MNRQEGLYIRLNNRRYVKLLEKVKRLFLRCLGKIVTEDTPNGKIILLPESYNKNKLILNIVTKQLHKIIKNTSNPNLIFDRELDEEIIKYNVLSNRKILMKYMLCNILDYIYEIKGTVQQFDDLYLFVDNCSSENIKIINQLINKFKTVNIITQNISKFRRIEERYEEKNVLITVLNNKRKSARNARMIVNIDFTQDELNKYVINQNATIINLNKGKYVGNYGFNGIIVNDFNIIINENLQCFIKEFYGNIDVKAYLENCIVNMRDEERNSYLARNKVGITEIIGVRGKINKQEFIRN